MGLFSILAHAQALTMICNFISMTHICFANVSRQNRLRRQVGALPRSADQHLRELCEIRVVVVEQPFPLSLIDAPRGCLFVIRHEELWTLPF